jgi:4-hydroxy-tetrahydrodipicolinate synthase
MHLKGTFTAMITPFLHNQIDEEGLIRTVERQIAAGITGLLFLGTTGEAATLTDAEQSRVIEIGVKRSKGRALIIVGTGCNSTPQTIEKTQRAKDLGADIAQVITPYYNRPTQEGLYRHFEALTRAVDIPILVYNNPGRTGVNIEPSTLLKIASLPKILGIKDSSGDINQAGDFLHTVTPHYPLFSLLSGDDILTLPLMALGATGLFSVVGNLVPEPLIALVNSALEGQFHQAREIHKRLYPLFKLSSIETNPIPIKEAMHLCGLPAGESRLPLCAMSPENREKLSTLLSEMGLR